MEVTVILICTAVMLLLLFLRMPVFVAVLTSTILYFMMTPEVPTRIIAQRVVSGMESTSLLAIPFFVCAGVFMNSAGVTKRLMNFCYMLVARLPGGLAHVNVLLSTLMGGLSGSNLADASMQAKMLVPEMERKGFSRPFSSVVTATSAMITPLIPPGIAMIIYGSIANVSIGKLFVAGIGPGVLLCLAMMILVTLISKRRNYQSDSSSHYRFKDYLKAFTHAFLPLCFPVIIIGGIRFGIFTPTEAGSVAVAYALLLGLIYREMSFKDIVSGIKATITITSAIMLIIGAASAFSWVLTKERIPQAMIEFFVNHISHPVLFLLIVNVLLLLIGMLIEGNAVMIVLVPLLAPVATAFGIDEIQFAMMIIFNTAIGAISPPMGTLMLVTCGITQCRIDHFIKEAVPFYILLFVCLMLITFFPLFTTGLVRLVF